MSLSKRRSLISKISSVVMKGLLELFRISLIATERLFTLSITKKQFEVALGPLRDLVPDTYGRDDDNDDKDDDDEDDEDDK